MCAERYDQVSVISGNTEREQMRQTVGEATLANSSNAKEPHGSPFDAGVFFCVFPLLLL